MFERAILTFPAVVACWTAAAADVYAPPEGCVHEATVRNVACVTEQVSVCPSQVIIDEFRDQRHIARKFYEHPGLFTFFIHATGARAGHDYGDGAPRWGDVLAPGQSYVYRREVWKNFETPGPGADGTERLTVGDAMSLQVGGRSLRVLPLEFEVEGAAGDYRLKERSYLLDAPRVPIGSYSEVYDGAGNLVETHDASPASISLPGESGFGSPDPALHCGAMSS